MSTTKRDHPCAKFQRGEVKDFYTAMEVYIAQYREELRISREIVREYPSSEPGKDAKMLAEQSQGVEEIELIVAEAKLIYREYVEEAVKRAAAKMRETGDPHAQCHLRPIADALESGNYEGLSV